MNGPENNRVPQPTESSAFAKVDFEFRSKTDPAETSQNPVIRLELSEGIFADSLSLVLAGSLTIDSAANLVVIDRLPEKNEFADAKIFLLMESNTVALTLERIQTLGIVGIFDPVREGVEQLFDAIAIVEAGYMYLHQDTLAAINSGSGSGERQALDSPSAELKTEIAKLTPREIEVMECLSRRLSNKEIARALYVSLFTVKNHVSNILQKMEGMEDRYMLGEWYLENKHLLPAIYSKPQSNS